MKGRSVCFRKRRQKQFQLIRTALSKRAVGKNMIGFETFYRIGLSKQYIKKHSEYKKGDIIMKKWLFFLLLLSVLLLSACTNSDDLAGKTFDVSSGPSPVDPDEYDSIMTLEFSDGNKVKNTMGYEDEGTYELIDDKLVILFENENESLEIEFTLEENEKDFSTYSAEITDSNLEIEDSNQVSKYKGLYQNLADSYFEFIERT